MHAPARFNFQWAFLIYCWRLPRWCYVVVVVVVVVIRGYYHSRSVARSVAEENLSDRHRHRHLASNHHRPNHLLLRGEQASWLITITAASTAPFLFFIRVYKTCLVRSLTNEIFIGFVSKSLMPSTLSSMTSNKHRLAHLFVRFKAYLWSRVGSFGCKMHANDKYNIWYLLREFWNLKLHHLFCYNK